ncbi:RNA polymerase sigma factor [Acerihabitans arboris]|uniref:Sigma-70 family RNA polymerase sigma factor n=1 Tax=Acerihabitans arboris TaxID=2691583 RepID=A0A845SLA0_9GAMM|nr:RNA polymerase sigma factor [Acerihabitans arboris]NDL63391.1 sigma-70 family RNA polymerase sigma factor [Acerihabitans arboris]
MTDALVEISFDRVCLPFVNWEDIFRQQQKKLQNFIRKRVANKEDIEDLAQMTYLEVLRNCHKFSGASKPETWVFGIALNLIRNHYKTHKGQYLTDVLNEEDTYDLTHDNDPCHIIENAQLLRIAMASIENFSPQIKEMLSILVERDGSYQDVAAVLNIPVGTVRSRLSRVRESLKNSTGL